MFERLLEDLGFQRLLTEQPLQLAHLALQSPIIRGRHDLLAAAGSRQRPLHHKPAPREQLVRGNAMGHQAYRHARLKGLFDDPNLLSRCPAPTALNRCDDLNSIRRIALPQLSPFVEDKANLAPLRLVSFFALAVTAERFVGYNNPLLRGRIAQLIIRCGRHSLQAFCLGILLSVFAQILLTSFRDDIVMQLAISFAGILLMMGVAGLLTWYKANNAMHSDAATVESTNSEAQGRSVVGIGSTGELTTAIARFAVRTTLRAVANIGPQARIGIMMTDSADETRRARWNREAA